MYGIFRVIYEKRTPNVRFRYMGYRLKFSENEVIKIGLIQIPRNLILGYSNTQDDKLINDVPAQIFCEAFLSFNTNKLHRCRFKLEEIKQLSGLNANRRIDKNAGRVKRILDSMQNLIRDGALCIERECIRSYRSNDIIDAEWFPVPHPSSYVSMEDWEYSRLLENNAGSMTMYDLFIYLYIKGRLWVRRSGDDFRAQCARVSQQEIEDISGIRQPHISRIIAHLANDLDMIAYKNMATYSIKTDSSGARPYKPKSVYVLKQDGWEEELTQGVAEYTSFLQEKGF